MIICPCCEGDTVWLVELNGHPFRMCSECDSVWPQNIDIDVNSAQNFENYIKQKGEIPDWSKLIKVQMLEQFVAM